MVDRLECPGVYIDDRVRSERWVRRNPLDPSTSSTGPFTLPEEPEALRHDVELLLEICKQIYLCHSGTSFGTKLAELSDRTGDDCTPILAFFDIDLSNEESNVAARRKAARASWTDTNPPPSPGSVHRTFTFSSQSDEAHGLSLLSGVSTDIQVHDGPNLVVPIAILRAAHSDLTDNPALEPINKPQAPSLLTLEHKQIARCLDAGAIDVLNTPLDRSRIQGLVVHAYRTRRTAQKDMSRFLARKKLRKHSWVGVHDEQPYAYLREAMVSKLMKGICNPEEIIDEFQERDLNVEPEREPYIREQVGNWKFSAHEFSDDELVFAATEMLQHALKLPELEHWRLTPGEIKTFLLACRAAYNSFVLYHNFRHAIDVLQSVFCFLLHIGALPPYKPIGQAAVPKSPIASLLSSFDALTLLISAIGHDVGHPGVNNFFLVKLNAPLAQLYNDNSVLETFHCAAFSQILRRHWPAVFKDKQLRKLLISSILATDMGVHQKFMERMELLQEKFHENRRSIDGWRPQDMEMYKSLLCGLLMKCADISNVARPWRIAEKWTQILQEEFANQGEMEKEVGMETALFGGPPELGNTYKLATGQIGFMSIFALPLFEGVSDLLPQLQFTVDYIRRNQARWQQLSNAELKKQLRIEERAEITVSLRSQSPAADASAGKWVMGADGAADDAASVGTPLQSGAYNDPIPSEVSPGTPGPQIDITGDRARKSSSAVPDLSYFSIPSAAQAARGPVGTQYHNPLADTTRPPEAPAVPAAPAERDCAGEPVPEIPNSTRQGPSQSAHRHHTQRYSSGRTQVGCNGDSYVRTQSISTHSNTMTPISPSTNATSFLAVDSGDEKRRSGESVGQSDSGGLDDSSTRPSTRPSTSDAYAGDHESSYSPTRSAGRSYGAGAGHFHSDEGTSKDVQTAVNGARSPTQSTTTTESVKNEGQHGEDPSVERGTRRLPKRRSRLRLAFWKRRNPHQQEVRGET